MALQFHHLFNCCQLLNYMLTIKETKEIPEQHYLLLANLLNTAWKDLILTTPEHIKSRFASGNKFLAVYGKPNMMGEEHLTKIYGNIPLEENLPLGLLETIALRTLGNMDLVPKNYKELTNDGFWKNPVEKADTLIMVDVTKIPFGPKEVPELLMTSIKNFLQQSSFEYAWTYTPNIKNIKQWHETFGAIDSHYILPYARPGWKEPAVNFMDYSRLIK